jgi:hypothetical protein
MVISIKVLVVLIARQPVFNGRLYGITTKNGQPGFVYMSNVPNAVGSKLN